MSKRSLPALIVLNVALLVLLGISLLLPSNVEAQLGGGGNDYLMISGAVRGRTNQDVVYIVETNSARMVAVTYRSANDEFEIVDATSIADDMRGGGRSRR